MGILYENFLWNSNIAKVHFNVKIFKHVSVDQLIFYEIKNYVHTCTPKHFLRT